MRRLTFTILLGALGSSLAPTPLHAQTSVDVRFDQLRAERFEAIAVADAAARRPLQLTTPTLPETPQALFESPWRVRFTESEWKILRESFQAEGVPVELLAVGWVESRFNPRALSPKGARGIWQFMPETARRYGLQVSDARDDRIDFGLSTRAAARHLADLYRQFGDWRLALAAYNAGADRVDLAIARARTRDFRLIRPWLPAETQDYVPSVLRFSTRGAIRSPGTTQQVACLKPACDQ
ncbi:MAG TPA: lytic transglycosylase domain-containing protein [Candidatus Acidoferrales bacterium]|nr:lytic transglycosylase domain-containing protein [Candidatus Acidoferrales bacterium]